jgi:hypothetical protein
MVFEFVGLSIHVVRSSKPWKVCNVGGCEWNMNVHARASWLHYYSRPAGRNTIPLLHKKKPNSILPIEPAKSTYGVDTDTQPAPCTHPPVHSTPLHPTLPYPTPPCRTTPDHALNSYMHSALLPTAPIPALSLVSIDHDRARALPSPVSSPNAISNASRRTPRCPNTPFASLRSTPQPPGAIKLVKASEASTGVCGALRLAV